MSPLRWRPWRPIPPRSQAGPLRCLFVITSMPVGGAETLLVNMMRRIDRDQLSPEVVCLKEPGPLGEQVRDEFPLHTGLLRSKWDLAVLPRLIRLIHRRRADVVITVGAGDKMFWGRLAAHVAGVPVIASALHSTGWPDGVGRLNRCLTGMTDAFIAVADSHGQFLKEFERFPEAKVRVIRNGVDCNRFRPDRAARSEVRAEFGLSPNTPLIGIVAALRPEKNHAMMIRAAKAISPRFPEARWLIVGDGPERGRLESLAMELGVDSKILFLGTRQDTPRLVAALDLFTLCSHNEASPVSILEALACEVPVVATDVGSVSESVQEGKTGFLVRPDDDAAFEEAIWRILASPSLREGLGHSGRQLVLRSGSLSAMVNGYENLATELYDAKSGGGVSSAAGNCKLGVERLH